MRCVYKRFVARLNATQYKWETQYKVNKGGLFLPLSTGLYAVRYIDHFMEA
jgi:hypothetical protein